jgi:hypothetical protein
MIKSKNIESKFCIFCGKKFFRNTKPKRKLPSGVRKYNSSTCGSVCAKSNARKRIYYKDKIKEYREKNKEKLKEKIKISNRKYYKNNKEKIKLLKQKYYQKNKEKLKEYYQKNKEYYKKYNKKYRSKREKETIYERI